MMKSNSEPDLSSDTNSANSEKVFEIIFDSCLEGILLVDSAGRIVKANGSSEEMFRYAPGELDGRRIEDLIPGPSRTTHSKRRKDFMLSPTTRRMGVGRDLQGLRKDGTEFPVEVSLNHTRLDDQQMVIAFVIDISKRKDMELQAERERENAQMYLDVAGSMFVVIGLDQKVQLINKRGCELLGLPESQIIGKNWFGNFIPKGERKLVRRVFNQVAAGQIELVGTFENKILNIAGEEIYMVWRNSVIQDQDGNISGALSSGINITERKKAEDALRRNEERLIIYASELETRVQDRTEELAQAVEKLKQTNKNLQREVEVRIQAERDVLNALEKERELNELKTRFVSIASHEFRTPLSTILSSASLIGRYNETTEQPKRDRHISRIKTSVENLTNILDDFLSMGRLDEGTIQTNPAEFDLVQLAKEVAEEMQPVAAQGQQVILKISGKPHHLNLDRQIIKNIMINLLSNAIKYSPNRENANLSINFGKKQVAIQVEDKGLGIPKEDQVRLFERFYRAHNVTNIQGTGLGLNIVKKYVELLEGKINYKSVLGQGSSFRVKLPAKYSDK